MAKANRICSIPDCGKPHKAHGWCRAHYERWKLHGDPGGGATPRGAVKDWVLSHINYDGDVCLWWPFSASDLKGYAMMRWNGRTTSAHKVLCEMAHGAAPSEKHEVAHSCGNGHLGCVNPRHLRWATRSENHKDKLKHGTDDRGDKSPNAKLSVEQVRDIRRRLSSETLQSIANDFGVSASLISAIRHRKRWSWLEK